MFKKINFGAWFDKNYKLMIVLPVAILLICIIYLGIFYSQNGSVFLRDVSLSGGTTLTLNGNFDSSQIEEGLKSQFADVSFRKLNDVSTGVQLALVIESSATPEELSSSLKDIGFNLTEENSSVEFTGASLSNNFYSQLMVALLASFICMSFVIFIMFRTFIPSIAVIFAAFADIVMPLALLNFLGIKLSAAGIAAFLMLIGYSVDTDILLTSRALKKGEGTLNQRIFQSFKTGILMTSTALLAVLPAFFLVTGLPESFKQIFFILSLGLFADIINTWLTNVGIIKWYCVSKGIN
jgi:preprotein translocase subunit SecF